MQNLAAADEPPGHDESSGRSRRETYCTWDLPCHAPVVHCGDLIELEAKDTEGGVIGTFGPIGLHSGWRTVILEVIGVTNEQVLADVVRAWVKQQLPDSQGAEGRAAGLALRCYQTGASLSEACHQASVVVESWSRHFAHWKVAQDAVVRPAS